MRRITIVVKAVVIGAKTNAVPDIVGASVVVNRNDVRSFGHRKLKRANRTRASKLGGYSAREPAVPMQTR